MSTFVNNLVSSSTYEEFSKTLENIRAKENEYRTIFANPSINPSSECLSDKYCMLFPIYDQYELFKYRDLFPEEAALPKICQLEVRKGKEEQCISTSEEFKENFDVLTEGMLRKINWNNVVVAGGSVQACLHTVSKEYNKSRKTLRKYFHEKEYSGVDVDIFIYGLDEDEAK